MLGRIVAAAKDVIVGWARSIGATMKPLVETAAALAVGRPSRPAQGAQDGVPSSLVSTSQALLYFGPAVLPASR